MRLATFNILHGRSPVDGRVDVARFAAAVERIDADVLGVLAVRMPVLGATDILSAKMRVLGEHYCDFTRLLAMARALREQVDWERLRAETAGHPFARAFLHLVHELGVSPLGPAPRSADPGA